jgi:uncharacterized linocin/CFP29 family protein
MRKDAPFGEEVWSAIDAAVVAAAKQVLVGRRFLPFTGPLGPGTQAIPIDKLSDIDQGAVSIFGEEDAAVAHVSARHWVQLPLLYKDFLLGWRDVEMEHQYGIPVDTGAAYAAAAACARLEDQIVFNGSPTGGLPGLMTVEGHLSVAGGDLKQPGRPLAVVSEAIGKLAAAGSLEPYALVLTPELFTHLFAIHPETGRLEFALISERCKAGVFQSTALPDNHGVVVSVLPHQLDLVVGLDMACGYMGPEKMNHLLRVMETVALRIRRPSAICTLD